MRVRWNRKEKKRKKEIYDKNDKSLLNCLTKLRKYFSVENSNAKSVRPIRLIRESYFLGSKVEK